MDIVQKISRYLELNAHLRDTDDSLNIVDGQIFGWNFKNIPQPTEQDLIDAESQIVALEARNATLKAIADLEASVTARRVREAFLSGDKSFIENVEAQIEELRKGLV